MTCSYPSSTACEARRAPSPGAGLFTTSTLRPERASSAASVATSFAPSPFPAAGLTIASERARLIGQPSRVTTRVSSAWRERLADRVLFLVRERITRPAGLHRLREHARVGAAVKARDDDAGPLGVEERDRERLVAAGVAERAVPHDTDLLDRALRDRLELLVKLVERVETLGEAVEPMDVLLEELVEAHGVSTGKHPAQTASQSSFRSLQQRDPHGEDHDGCRESEHARRERAFVQRHARTIPGGRGRRSADRREAHAMLEPPNGKTSPHPTTPETAR